ncbi:HNH endonuclease [Cohnella kolymensis]|uniref:HNH endonuclease n=1 Tax=Cohnella kolymensis TaxID=1590652 RepID=UPI0038996B89
MLWGRSGNRCSICKQELVLDETDLDDASVIGEECHIISEKDNGPRHRNDYPTDQFDSYENLLLLCRVHHKMVDDQKETYTEDILRQLKNNHEKWVTERLNKDDFKESKNH